MLKIVPVIIGASIIAAAPAFAVSENLKQACTSDYVAYCSKHPLDTPAMKSCMRAHRKMLTQGCAKAILAAGEATDDDVRAYKRESKQQD